MTESNTPLRIVELKIENVKRLSAVSITPAGNTVIIGGNNANGKSSVLDSIEMAFTGKKCDKPVRDGAESGRVVADLGEIIITRTFTEAGGGTLVVKSADGTKLSSPQGILDKLYGSIAFDPLDFTRMKPKDQLEELRRIVGVNTTLIDTSRQAKYDERTQVNRKVAELKATIATMPFHEDAPKEPLSAAELSAKISEGNAANTARADYIRRGNSAKNAVTLFVSNIASIKNQIETLQRSLADQETGHKQSLDELEKLRAQADDFLEVNVSGLAVQMDDISALNKKLDENTTRNDAEEALTKWEANSIALTNAITDLDERKRKKLEDAKYPVAGLRLTDEGIIYNGIPFAQSSAAEQLRVSVGIGLSANPRLRVMLVRDGALLDSESLALLEKMAEDAEAQVWVERVGKGDECSIIIEDGRVEGEATK